MRRLPLIFVLAFGFLVVSLAWAEPILDFDIWYGDDEAQQVDALAVEVDPGFSEPVWTSTSRAVPAIAWTSTPTLAHASYVEPQEAPHDPVKGVKAPEKTDKLKVMVIPEPNQWALLALGLVGLFRYRAWA